MLQRRGNTYIDVPDGVHGCDIFCCERVDKNEPLGSDTKQKTVDIRVYSSVLCPWIFIALTSVLATKHGTLSPTLGAAIKIEASILQDCPSSMRPSTDICVRAPVMSDDGQSAEEEKSRLANHS